MHEIKYSGKKDLRKIAKCHKASFADSLSSKMGVSYLSKMLEWYISDDKKILFHIEENGKCLGYCGGMIIDGTQPMGSTSGMMQHSMNDAFISFMLRPWLIFHPEFKEKYSLVKKNIKARFGKRKNKPPTVSAKVFPEKVSMIEREIGLVVIGVAPDNQGKGYGTLLLKEFEKITIQLNIKKMGLAVERDNSKAIRSYERNGWKIDKEKENYFEMVKYIDSEW